MGDDFTYTGTSSLEVMAEAKKYNQFLETELVRFIGEMPRALDFGAGIGEFAQRLQKRGYDIDCVELDANQRARLQTLGHKAFASMDEISGKYNRIYSLNTLEHIEDDAVALRDLHHQLAPRGKLFLYVPAFMALYSDHDRQIGHFRRYAKGELRRKLENAHFQVDRIEYVDSMGFFAWMLMKHLPGEQAQINAQTVKLYDSVFFPLSRLADSVLKPLLGKNLLAVATRPD